jgi:NAD(P)-dependent dehydrogenase (short-subunit alcohol dehydrogenase family)
VYRASKYAFESLSDALRTELRPWRIPVSLIESVSTRTDMWGDAPEAYSPPARSVAARLCTSRFLCRAVPVRESCASHRKHADDRKTSSRMRTSRVLIAGPPCSCSQRRRSCFTASPRLEEPAQLRRVLSV